uniref:Synoviolin 1 n=1 Tax=Oryctolagus cuniculus TaxID=9986 RepID=A0A5F9C2E2_RABIT
MFRTAVMMAASLALTGAVVAHAYYLKHQFYPTVVYLTKSSPSMAVLYIQAFVLVFLLGKVMGKVFFGQLRAAEMEPPLRGALHSPPLPQMLPLAGRGPCGLYGTQSQHLLALPLPHCVPHVPPGHSGLPVRQPRLSQHADPWGLCAAGVWLRVRHPDDHGAHHLHQVRAALRGPPEREPLGQQGRVHALHGAVHRLHQGPAVHGLHDHHDQGAHLPAVCHPAHVLGHEAVQESCDRRHHVSPSHPQHEHSVPRRHPRGAPGDRQRVHHLPGRDGDRGQEAALQPHLPHQSPRASCRPSPPGMFPLWPPVGPFAPVPPPPSSGEAAVPPSSSAAALAGPSGAASAAGPSATAPAPAPGTGPAPEAGPAPGFPFPPPWMGMPLPPPFAFPPMPVPPAGFAGLTPEELRALEGHERQHLEARSHSLRNIHTLLGRRHAADQPVPHCAGLPGAPPACPCREPP